MRSAPRGPAQPRLLIAHTCRPAVGGAAIPAFGDAVSRDYPGWGIHAAGLGQVSASGVVQLTRPFCIARPLEWIAPIPVKPGHCPRRARCGWILACRRQARASCMRESHGGRSAAWSLRSCSALRLPAASELAGEVDPFTLGGLLYVGAALAVLPVRCVAHPRSDRYGEAAVASPSPSSLGAPSRRCCWRPALPARRPPRRRCCSTWSWSPRCCSPPRCSTSTLAHGWRSARRWSWPAAPCWPGRRRPSCASAPSSSSRPASAGRWTTASPPSWTSWRRTTSRWPRDWWPASPTWRSA